MKSSKSDRRSVYPPPQRRRTAVCSGQPPPFRAVTVLVTTAALAALFFVSSVRGQVVTVEVGAGTDGGQVSLALANLQAQGTTVDLAVRMGASWGIALDLRRSEAFGPLSNIVLEIGAAADSARRAQGEFAVRGVFGPVAGRATVVAFNDTEPAVSIRDLALDGRPRSQQGAFGVGLEVAADIRANQDLVVGVAPDLYLIEGLVSGRLGANVRYLRALGEADLTVLWHGYARPGFEAGHAAVGVGLEWRRRRAPAWSGSVWLGYRNGLLPGFRGRIAERLAGGGQVSLEAAVEPYRPDVHPFRMSAELVRPVGPGSLELHAALAWSGRLEAAATVGYQIPLEAEPATGLE